MLEGKTVLLGVTGSIAAYKIAYLASMLKKQQADVHVLMTRNATNFINPITFETLTGNKCLVDTFDRNFQFQVEHVSIAKKADVVMIAPASANVIGKLAHGIADDMLTTTIMACRCKKFISPAMNTNMFENPIVQDNLKTLEHYGYEVIDPAVGYLACGDTGAGKMPEPETLLNYILRECACEKDMKGLKVLVTAGPTQEAIDPVRYITNHSSGKMGYALAQAARDRGARVTLLTGPVHITPPQGVSVVPVTSTQSLYDAMLARCGQQDIIVQAAAPADYRVEHPAAQKLKKRAGEPLTLTLVENPDIAKAVGERKQPGQVLVGFAAETQNVLENARGKLLSKHLDLIVANDVTAEGAGFGTDTNIVTLISHGGTETLPLMSKREVAHRIWDAALALRGAKHAGQ